MSLPRQFNAPMLNNVVSKYFLDRSGIQTKRMANEPGKGHFDLAREIVGDVQDLYARMFKLGFVRVMETPSEIHVEAHTLTKHQRRFLTDRAQTTGKELIVNNAEFVESKDARDQAHKLVDHLLA